MKKMLLFLLVILSIYGVWYIINRVNKPKDCNPSSRRFFCLEDGHCATTWEMDNGVTYVIPGKYSESSCPPSSESYITSPYNGVIDIIWQKDNNGIIVMLQDERKQIIHKSPKGIKIIDYNLDKKHNDSVFLYFDKNYRHYKNNVKFLSIDLGERHGNSNKVVKDYK